MAYNPTVLKALRHWAPRSGAPVAYVAAALVESGLNPRAVGDNGDSVGLFQENINGRGHGLSFEQRADPWENARRAAEEFSRTGGAGPTKAYNAQRPADRAGYIRKVQERMEEARRILQGGGKVAGGGPLASPSPAGETAAPPELNLSDFALQALQAGKQAGSLTRRIGQAYLMSQLGGGPEATPAADKPTKIAPAGGGPRVPLVGKGGGFVAGGGPEAHGTRALGNWQSDNAYDIMGKSGQAVYSPVGGKVVKISGQPGGAPGFAGYGITVSTSQGDLFFKHLGSHNVKVGSTLKPGQLVGTLDASTAGGPHLHLGGTNRGQLDRLYAWYLGRD